MAEKVRFIRSSEVSKFMRCRRSWWLTYHAGQGGLGLTPVKWESGIRDLGTMVHAGVQAYYTGGDPVAHIIEQRTRHMAGESPLMPTYDEKWLKNYELAIIMLEGYVDWVAATGADVGESTVLVEERIITRIGEFRGDEVHLAGKPDRLVRDDVTGALILEDTKSVQTVEPPVLSINTQLLNYATILRLEGYGTVAEMRHNMLKKVKRTAKATPPFYARESVPLNEEMYDAHWRHLTSVLDELVHACQRVEAGEDWHVVCPPNPQPQCSWDCDFLGPCPMFDDGSDAAGYLAGEYQPRMEMEL